MGPLLAALYLLEFAACLIAIGIYKAPSPDQWLTAGKSTALIAAGFGVLVLTLRWLLGRFSAAGSSAGRAMALAVATNVIAVGITAGLLELGLRVLAVPTPQGMRIGSTILRPNWREIVDESRSVLESVQPWDSWDSSYFVFDERLGWTVGSNRQTADGLYFSSERGIRSGNPNTRFADDFAGPRIALLGDSNAFSFEVPFEESWGFHLQETLGEDVEVLNFGVDGYGLDQMLLRYERDVRPLNVDVVVVGFIGHDLKRSMAVYPFLSFGWPGYIVKPRFVLQDGELELLNVPLPQPDEILDSDSIDALPDVEHDLGYRTLDWSGRRHDLPMTIRFLASRFPRWPAPDPDFSEEATRRLNARILVRLAESIRSDGSAPIFVLLSDRPDRLDALARETLGDATISYLRVVECLEAIDPGDRLVESGNHYSGRANRAIARCTASAVVTELGL